MCGIFGQVTNSKLDKLNFRKLVMHSKQRGMDSSGLICYDNGKYKIYRADFSIDKLLKKVNPYQNKLVLGHSRLITNGLKDNQPVFRNDICVIHNGIIVNEKEVWNSIKLERKYKIDSETIVAITEDHLNKNGDISKIPSKVLSLTKGVVACAILLSKQGKLLLFSNNGSLYVGYIGEDIYFASEKFALGEINCKKITQIKDKSLIIDIPSSKKGFEIKDEKNRKENLIPEFQINSNEEKLLKYEQIKLKRCTRCILPETMPHIKFDNDGVCNYCKNYKKRNRPKPVQELFKLVSPYRKPGNQLECIVPFSGGRDSCYGLHLIVNELKMKPLTYTYDWGMVTDLGRRNISRMCSEMGVENIIVAADISKKRKNIRMNLEAWLKSPHLGMMAILTAGDKHFFRYVERIKKQTEINLNLWGINPLEQTHFKSGFLGLKPDFEEDKVYTNGIIKQIKYHTRRFSVMSESPGYFNSSLWDNLSGEYYRSFMRKSDYYHIFDYWTWEENIVNNILINQYDWETAIDTKTTWRIGDGTAGFYNYVYYTVAGFTEHDTFRSNQIREGQLSRKKALEIVADENFPRYQNIRWYLDTLGLNFQEVIKVVNQIPKIYNKI